MNDISLRDKTVFITILLLSVIFFFSNQDFYYSLLGNLDMSVDALESSAIEGNIKRRIAFLALGILAFIGLLAGNRTKLKPNGPLVWSLVFFALWSFLSIAWSIDPFLTFRKLMVFSVFAFGALIMVRIFPVNFLPWCSFTITSAYLFLGLFAELTLGTFDPLSGEYRFAGTVHPNVQSVSCAIMFLSALSLAQSSKGHRTLFTAAALLAMSALIITKSRTSFAGAMTAQVLFWNLSSPRPRRSIIIVGGIWFVCLLYFSFGDSLFSAARHFVLLGRTSAEYTTFTGRTHIWENVFEHISERPFLGSGFNTFWTPEHIREFSDDMGIGILNAHSVYLDLVLNLGLIGALSFTVIIALSIRNASLSYKATGMHGYGFLFVLLAFAGMQGLLESSMMEMSTIGTFLLISGLFHLSSPLPLQEPEKKKTSFTTEAQSTQRPIEANVIVSLKAARGKSSPRADRKNIGIQTGHNQIP